MHLNFKEMLYQYNRISPLRVASYLLKICFLRNATIPPVCEKDIVDAHRCQEMPGICRNTLMPRSFVGFRPEVPEAAHRFLVVLLEHPGQVVEGKRERRRRLIIYF